MSPWISFYQSDYVSQIDQKTYLEWTVAAQVMSRGSFKTPLGKEWRKWGNIKRGDRISRRHGGPLLNLEQTIPPAGAASKDYHSVRSNEPACHACHLCQYSDCSLSHIGGFNIGAYAPPFLKDK